MELTQNLISELNWLYKTYKQGSQGLLYSNHSKLGTCPHTSFIRVKKLERRGLAKFVKIVKGHPVYSITEDGLNVIKGLIHFDKYRISK